jgi:hypothetical protein
LPLLIPNSSSDGGYFKLEGFNFDDERLASRCRLLGTCWMRTAAFKYIHHVELTFIA